jgi:phage host-nuclease inhibitor protein Gam
MDGIDILHLIGGLGLSVIAYFLKRTMDEIKEVKQMSYDTKEKVAKIEVDYLNKISNLNEKIDGLQQTIKDLTDELKEYNKRFRG